jgi:putative nucleotidyltransferase with HDIG domain
MTTPRDRDTSVPASDDLIGSVLATDVRAPGSLNHIDRLGPPFIHALFSAGKTLQIYDARNHASQVALTKLKAVLGELAEGEGRVVVAVASDLLCINDVRLIVDPQNAGPLLSLVDEMKRRNIEEVDFAPEIDAAEMGTFLRLLFAEPSGEDPFGELNHRLAEAAVTHVRLAERIERERHLRDAKVERREIREESNRVMSRAVSFMGEVLRTIEQRRPIQLPKAHRITQQLADIIRVDETVLVGLASIKDYDEYTFSHSVNVSVISMLIADRMGLGKTDIAQIGVAALLHDIGKTHIPQPILSKPGTLTAPEWDLMERHPMLGVIELSRVRSLRAVLDPMFVSLQHHLLFDLTGYPRKPGGWKIHPYVQVVTVADVYDALTTPRVYRTRTLTPDRALCFILRRTGAIFDPLVARVLIKTMGVYPVGTMVELDNGAYAVVVRQNEQARLAHRPHVVMLEKSGPRGEPVDLAEKTSDGTAYRRTIVRSFRERSLESQKASCFVGS